VPVPITRLLLRDDNAEHLWTSLPARESLIVAVLSKKTEADYLRELGVSQPEEIEKAELSVGKPGAGPPPISIRLSRPLLEALDRIAEREHRKRSNLIQHILWEYVHDETRKPQR
jgi:hypothetical protein